MVNFNFEYNKKKISLDAIECKTFFAKASGLMFRNKSKPLLFVFKNSCMEAIHSFFCVPFIVIWFNEGKIIDYKFVKTWKPYILPKKSFDKFLEIPINSVDFPRIKNILGL